MQIVANILVALVALEHAWFLILEMFLWQKPIGLRTFDNTPERAKETSVLAANQGLYNGFLAAGLVLGLSYPDPGAGKALIVFVLLCVIIAGFYGGYSVSRRILLVQAVPALLALVFVLLA